MLIEVSKQVLAVEIPLTKHRSKVRIKKRNSFREYGEPVATRKEAFSQSCYVEWQIEYDELSKILLYFYNCGAVDQETLLSIKAFLQQAPASDYVYNPVQFALDRSILATKQVSGRDFLCSPVERPILIHQFESSEIFLEIQTKEKQYAVGLQPMLYFCFPITELESGGQLMVQTAKANEIARFIINRSNIRIFLETAQIFGTLSSEHNRDILAILENILSRPAPGGL